MNPLETLDQETLLDMLTKYYTNYRQVVEINWNQKDCTTYRTSLDAILRELNRRTEAAQGEGLAPIAEHERGKLSKPRR